MDIFGFLEANSISYERFDHAPVYTCDEAKELISDLPGTPTKNLFLRSKSGKRHFVVVVGYDKTVELKSLAKLLGESRVSFASVERLEKYLGVAPGAVSLLALANDSDRAVEVYFDKLLWESESFRCHPLVNTSTLVVSRADLEKLLSVTGHKVNVVEVP